MKKVLIPVVMLMLTTLACKKKNEPSNPVGTTNFKTYSSMEDVFTMLAQQPKVMIFDAGAGTSFYGNSGVRYIFPPSCFMYATGIVVTGNVQVEVTEYPKKGDMIFSGVLPVSDGLPLVSGGEFYVKASKDGQALFVNPGVSYKANLPQFGSKDTVMSLFTGNTNGGTATNKVNWQVSEPDTTIIKNRWIKYSKDTTEMICDSFHFWNCDHFMGLSNLQDFKITVTATNADISKVVNLLTYTLFDKDNALIPAQSPANNNVYEVKNIPMAPVHFVSFGLINGHFYGGVSVATPKTGENYTVTLTEVDPKDFKAQINGLY